MSRRVRLGDIADVFNGKTPSKAEQRNRGHPVLKVRDVDEHGRHRRTTLSFVEYELAAKYRNKWVHPGDTLILNAAHNADYVASKIYFAGEEAAGSLATGEWMLVRPRTDLANAEYLNFWLRSEGARDSIRFLVKGIHLYPKDMADLELVLPALAEQHRIGGLLSRAEGIVRLRREARQKAAALIPAMFVDMFGEPATNPKGWEIYPLSDVADVISGVAKGRQLAEQESIELPYMRVANVKDGHLDMAEVKTIHIKKTEVEKLRILPGDLLMTEGGDPDKLGRAALWRGEIDLCVHQNHIFKVRGLKGRLVPEYLRSLAGSAYGKAYFLSVAKKTTGIASINKAQLSAFPVLLPPLAEQEKFKRQVEAVEAIVALQVAAARKADATFSALLAKAFRPAALEVQHEAERALA